MSATTEHVAIPFRQIRQDKLSQPIVPICGQEEDNPVVDIVFAHGLAGDPIETWNEKPTEDFWPCWLGRDIPGCRVWSLDYDAKFFSVSGATLSLKDRATTMTQGLIRAGLGTIPVVWIGHSLGGLVIKQILRTSSDLREEWGEIINATSAVLFFGTPHAGSGLASVLKNIPLAPESLAITDLQKFAPTLMELNRWYSNRAVQDHNVRTVVFCETQKTKMLGIGAMVVDRGSSNPSITGVEPVPFPTDHLGVCKITHPSDQRYQEVKRCVDEAVKTGLNSTRQPGRSGNSSCLSLLPVDAATITPLVDCDESLITIGRAPSNVFSLDDDEVSWEHAQIILQEGDYHYRHLSSTNPSIILRRGKNMVLVPGEAQQHRLMVGDRLIIGTTSLDITFDLIADSPRYVPTNQAQ